MKEIMAQIPWSLVWAIFGALALKAAWVVARELALKIKDERIRALVLDWVSAAEKQYGGVVGNGDTKRYYVERQAATAGVEVGRAKIEAAVHDLDLARAASGLDLFKEIETEPAAFAGPSAPRPAPSPPFDCAQGLR